MLDIDIFVFSAIHNTDNPAILKSFPQHLDQLYKEFGNEDGRNFRGILTIHPMLTRFLLMSFEEPIGMATISRRLDGTGLNTIGTVEDVFITSTHRQRGYGKTLMNRVIDFARESLLFSLELTSHPRRVRANALYQRLGFELIAIASPEKSGTNFYRMYL